MTSLIVHFWFLYWRFYRFFFFRSCKDPLLVLQMMLMMFIAEILDHRIHSTISYFEYFPHQSFHSSIYSLVYLNLSIRSLAHCLILNRGIVGFFLRPKSIETRSRSFRIAFTGKTRNSILFFRFLDQAFVKNLELVRENYSFYSLNPYSFLILNRNSKSMMVMINILDAILEKNSKFYIVFSSIDRRMAMKIP